jgi:hypothetical protein
MSYYYDKEIEILQRIKRIEEEIYLMIELAKHPELFEFKPEI